MRQSKGRLSCTVKHGVDVDKYLLKPNTTYKLYAVKDSGGMVINVAKFTTDDFDPNSSPFVDSGDYNDNAIGNGRIIGQTYTGNPIVYVYDTEDSLFAYPYFLRIDALNTALIDRDKDHRISHILGDSLSIASDALLSALMPSQTTDGTLHYKEIGGSKILAQVHQNTPAKYFFNDQENELPQKEA